MYNKEKPGEDGNPQPGNDQNLQDQNNDWITDEQVNFAGAPEDQFFKVIELAGLFPPTTGFVDDGKPHSFDGIKSGQYDCEYWFDGSNGGFKTPDEKKWFWKIGEPAKREPDKKPTPLAIRCMADIETKPIDWLWSGKIARGKTTMIAGNPGLGKSQLTLWLAAITSTGGKWPNSMHNAPVGGVLIISGEDAADDTIKPRLIAVGADLDKIHIIDGIPSGKDSIRDFDLSRDIELLAQQLAQMPDIRLVIIDPVSAYLGGTDSHKNAEVRALLSPLSALAEKHNVAIVLVSHLSKSGGEAIGRVNGSGAFVAAVRAAFLVGNEIENGTDTGRRLFVPFKNNIGPDNSGLAFKVESHRLQNGIETSRIVWQDDIIRKSADEVLAAILTIGANDSPKRKEAETFLQDILKEGPLARKHVKRLAGEAGISWRTIERAKKKLRIIAKRNGFGKDAFYEWSLPQNIPPSSIDRQAPDTGGPCNGTPANLPTDGPLPMDRQMADNEGLAVHANPNDE